MLYSVVTSIRKKSPVPVEFVFLKRHNINEEERLKDLQIKIQERPWTQVTIPKLRTVWLFWCAFAYPAFAFLLLVAGKKSTKSSFMQQMLDADLVLDLGGDSYSSDYGTLSIITLCIPLLIARIFGKPYYFCAQSIGHLSNTFPYKVLKFLLKDADLITTRERITDDFLASCNIKKNVVKTQDLAFILPVATSTRVDEICRKENIAQMRNFVGISISSLISKYLVGNSPIEEKEKQYIAAMSKMCDHLVDKHNRQLIFVPHVEADRATSEKVKACMKNPDSVSILKGDYSPEELKGIVSLCDIFVGSRMHATLAALSQAIPTLTFAYNHKALGINGTVLGQSDYLIDIRELDISQLLGIAREKVDQLIEHRKEIKEELLSILPEIKNTAEKNALYALDLLETAGPLKYMNDPSSCTGCGTCAAACPSDSIVMRKTAQGTYRPGHNGPCTNCKLCRKVCPALGFDICEEEKSFFGHQASDIQTGVFNSVHAGYALDQETRFKGSSGGLVTALSAFLLDSKSVDAVLLTKADKFNPLLFQSYWATTSKDVWQSRGSKYIPIPVNQALKTIPSGAQTICTVGLPCHLWALHLYEKAGLLKKVQIKYRFSLFCGKTPNFHATDFVIDKSNIKPEFIEKLQYRGDGWPAGLKITSSTQNLFVPLSKIWSQILNTPFFLPVNCYRCPDFFGYLSDISFGDAWLPDLAGDPNGYSVCLSRTDKGGELLSKAIDKKIIYLEQRSLSEIKKAFTGNLVAKIDRSPIKASFFKTPPPVYRNDAQSDTHLIRKKNKWGEKFYLAIMHLFAYRSFRDKFLNYPSNAFMKVTRKVTNKLLH